jgi:ribosome production factor 2
MLTFLLDFFRGDTLEKINLASVNHIIVFTSAGKKIMFRHYAIALRKGSSSSDVPQVVLEEYGPRMDLLFSRKSNASEAVQKESRRQPKELRPKKRKNVSDGLVGTITGRVHMQKQNLSELALRKFKRQKA